jgi:hypothetical protein
LVRRYKLRRLHLLDQASEELDRALLAETMPPCGCGIPRSQPGVVDALLRIDQPNLDVGRRVEGAEVEQQSLATAVSSLLTALTGSSPNSCPRSDAAFSTDRKKWIDKVMEQETRSSTTHDANGFKKGHEKFGGRKVGSVNRTTKLLKEAIRLAAELEGSDVRAKTSWLVFSAKLPRKIFEHS